MYIYHFAAVNYMKVHFADSSPCDNCAEESGNVDYVFVIDKFADERKAGELNLDFLFICRCSRNV